MKLLLHDRKKHLLKINVTQIEDLWYLRYLIEPHDILKGDTFRKIKLSGEGERSQSVIRKIFCSIEVEKVEFTENVLRANGKIIEGPPDLAKGSYHTFTIELHSTVTLEKKNWLLYHDKILNDACADSAQPILVLICDREDAIFAQLKKYGHEILTTLHGDVPKKDNRATSKGTFYQEVIEKMEYYVTREGISSVIIASPAFFAQEIIGQVKNKDLAKKITTATCNSVTAKAINEVLLRPEIKHVLEKNRSAKEYAALAELLLEIKKDGPAVYGKKETTKAAEALAIKKLLVTDGYLHTSQENNGFLALESLMRKAEQSKGEIMILSSDNDAGRQLDGLGGIAAVLHYKLAL